jgi:hypothetical protein
MAIEFYDPELEDALSADLLDFDPENPVDDEDYNEKVQRLQEETAEYHRKYPQFWATCEWCCEDYRFYGSHERMQATELNYNRLIKRLVRRGWIVLPGQWNELSERESVKSNCFHKACHEACIADSADEE